MRDGSFVRRTPVVNYKRAGRKIFSGGPPLAL